MRCYEYYKARWEKTKPIRGRSTDVRPIDNSRRYRDWERIAKVIVNGQEVYACQLYDTDVVRYYPDGSIGLMIDTWATPMTADFMHCHSPFFACKKYNQIWVYPKGHSADECYPIPKETEVKLVLDENGQYKPENPVMLTQKVIDRKKAKEAREKIKPFIDWARAFNKLTDGWVMQETREQFAPLEVHDPQGWSRLVYKYKLPEDVARRSWYGRVTEFDAPQAYAFLQNCDDDGYMQMYLAMTDDYDKAVGRRMVKQVDVSDGNNSRKVELYDTQFKWETIQRLIYKIVQDSGDVYKTIEVAPTKPITGVV